MSCLDVPIESFYNVNKSCQVIVGNPLIGQGLKSPQFQGTRVFRLSQRSRTQQGLVKSGISINRQLSSLFIRHSLTLNCSTQLRKIKTLGQGRKRLLLSGDHLTILGFTFGADSISEEVGGFSPFMVSSRKNTMFIVSCV